MLVSCPFVQFDQNAKNLKVEHDETRGKRRNGFETSSSARRTDRQTDRQTIYSSFFPTDREREKRKMRTRKHQPTRPSPTVDPHLSLPDARALFFLFRRSSFAHMCVRCSDVHTYSLLDCACLIRRGIRFSLSRYPDVFSVS